MFDTLFDSSDTKTENNPQKQRGKQGDLREARNAFVACAYNYVMQRQEEHNKPGDIKNRFAHVMTYPEVCNSADAETLLEAAAELALNSDMVFDLIETQNELEEEKGVFPDTTYDFVVQKGSPYYLLTINLNNSPRDVLIPVEADIEEQYELLKEAYEKPVPSNTGKKLLIAGGATLLACAGGAYLYSKHALADA